jgi:hypothetical protein
MHTLHDPSCRTVRNTSVTTLSMAKLTEFEPSIRNGRIPKMKYVTVAFKVDPNGPPFPILADEEVTFNDIVVTNCRILMKGNPIDSIQPSSWIAFVGET